MANYIFYVPSFKGFLHSYFFMFLSYHQTYVKLLEPHNQVTGLSVSLKVRAIRRSIIGLSVTLC